MTAINERPLRVAAETVAKELQPPRFDKDVCVIGGGGHVGLPLALTFADAGQGTLIYDVNPKTIDMLKSGHMPFRENGADELLRRVLGDGTLEVDLHPNGVARCKFLVLIVGTPVDEHLNPSFTAIHKALDSCRPYLRDGQTLILRSTVFPGITRQIRAYLKSHGLDIGVAFCPERVAQGHSLTEFKTLPQIISAFDEKTLAAVKELFGHFCSEMIEMAPMEAELCKLMTNSWRYIQFAAVNQFYMIATQHGLDFDRILHGCRHNYPRMAGMPGPGFAAGPCLMKDTMQLAAFSQNNFVLGHAAMMINEGLPAHLVMLAKQQIDLSEVTAGILGVAFKAGSDDPRDSLAFKLRKLLSLEARQVLTTDPYVPDPTLMPLDHVLALSDVLFVATPHHQYKQLKIPETTVVIDVWSCVNRLAE